MKSLTIVILVWGLSAWAGGSRDGYANFQKTLPDSNCRIQTDSLDEFRLVFTLPPFQKLASGEKTSLDGALSKWSSDMVAKVALQLEQELDARCRTPFIQTVIDECKRVYLDRLGVSAVGKTPIDLDKLFRGLTVPEKDRAELAKQLNTNPSKTGSVDDLLKLIYGVPATEVEGVLVLGESGPRRALATRVREFCPSFPCPFWDGRFLRRVVMVSQNGLALFEPELGVLFLSNEVVTEKHDLHGLVLLHELAHVAERGHFLVYKVQLADSFSRLSGWKKNPQNRWTLNAVAAPGKRNDELTALSAKSRFSILPDPILKGDIIRGQRADGFALGRSYAEVVKRNDVSEDLADHVGAFRFAPQRFCLDRKPFAPQKYAWVRERFFPKAPLLDCK